jgi:hypothetical protein
MLLRFGMENKPEPGLGMNIPNLIFENLDISFSFMGSKYSNSLMQIRIRESRIFSTLDTGWEKLGKVGSGIFT